MGPQGRYGRPGLLASVFLYESVAAKVWDGGRNKQHHTHSINSKLIGLSFLAHFILRTSSAVFAVGGPLGGELSKRQGVLFDW